MKIQGSHIVVTGASRGVGESIAREAVRRGARVTLIARSLAPLKALAAELDGHAIALDLSAAESLEGLIERIERDVAPIDALVNNAAVAHTGPFAAQSAESLRLHIGGNLLAPMELSRQVIPRMVARGHGNLLMISSVAGEIASRNMAAYGSSKAGLNQFTANLQRELRGTPLSVSLLLLGEVQTQMLVEGRKDPTVAAIANRVGAMGTLTPELVARRALDVLAGNRATAVLPAVAAPIYWLRQVPSRLMDFALRGVK